MDTAPTHPDPEHYGLLLRIPPQKAGKWNATRLRPVINLQSLLKGIKRPIFS